MRNEHPGVHLRSCLEALGVSQVRLAEECGISTKHLNQLVQGKVPMTASVAVQLEDGLVRLAARGRAELWMQMQAAYDVEVVRTRVEE